jgi:hypothetical protein
VNQKVLVSEQKKKFERKFVEKLLRVKKRGWKAKDEKSE